MNRALSLIGIVLMLISPGAAIAGQPNTVDTALMQPPLNPTFAWSCWRTGTGIVCDATRTLSWENDAYLDLDCDGRPVYSTGSESRTRRRR